MANKFEYKLIDSGHYDDSPVLFITEKSKYTQEESLELFFKLFWDEFKDTYKIPSIKDFIRKILMLSGIFIIKNIVKQGKMKVVQ